MYGPQQNYSGESGLPVGSLVATRRVEGDTYLEWSVGSAVTLDVEYDAYKLVRKTREYPRSESDGYELDSGVISVLGSTGTYVDDIADDEGTIIYYVLFCKRVSDSQYYDVAVAYCQKTQLHFGDKSKNFYPLKFQKEYAMTDFTNPMAFKLCLIDPVFGEVESLIKSMAVNFDIDEADPKALAGLAAKLNWNLSPLMDLIDFREQLKDLLENMRRRGQVGMSLELLEEISGLKCAVQQFKHCQLVSMSVDEDEDMMNYELDEIGVGDDVTQVFNYSASHEIERCTVRILDDTGDQVIVDDGDGALYLESSPGTPCGTVTYAGIPAIAASFPTPPVTGDTVWMYHEYMSGATDITDDETITRMLYLGDRMKRTRSLNKRLSWVAARVYLYLNLEVGEEGVTTFEEKEYLKLYVDDIKRKLRKFWPVFGVSDFYFTDRVVVSAPLDDYAGNLPLEQGCTEMRS